MIPLPARRRLRRSCPWQTKPAEDIWNFLSPVAGGEAYRREVPFHGGRAVVSVGGLFELPAEERALGWVEEDVCGGVDAREVGGCERLW